MFLRLCIFTFTILHGFLLLSSIARAENRIALVIGNADYEGSANKLDNPVNDANLMAQTLSSVGFEVTKVTNASQREMRQAMLIYSRSLAQADVVGVFYYAGHGMQVDGQNYLLPIDASPQRKDELSLHAVALSSFLRTLDSVSGSEGRLNVVILDACRNNPFARGWRSVSRGLATVDAPSGTLIAFATAPGDVAADGDGVNSPYTLALSKMMKKPGLAIEQTFKGARNLVWQMTQKSGKAQVPWESTSLRGDFYFVPGELAAKVSKGKTETQDKVGDDGVVAKSLRLAALERAADLKRRLQEQKNKLDRMNKSKGCRSLNPDFNQPVSIVVGQTLCSKDRASKAVIKFIRKRAIVFSVNGERNIVCTVKDLCQFNWPGAPLFRVKIKAGSGSSSGSGPKYLGSLIAAN